MAASLTLRVYDGANAGTESAAQTAIHLANADSLGSGGIMAGAYSYERWLRLRVDTAPANGVTNFWFQNEGVLPANVTLRFGVADLPATPVQTASQIATTELVAGRRYIWDTNTYDTVGDHSRYLVLQLQALNTATSGAISQQTPRIGWQES